MILLKKELTRRCRIDGDLTNYYRDEEDKAFLCRGELGHFVTLPDCIEKITVVIYDCYGPNRIKVGRGSGGWSSVADDKGVNLLWRAVDLLGPLFQTRKYVYVEIEYDEPDEQGTES